MNYKIGILVAVLLFLAILGVVYYQDIVDYFNTMYIKRMLFAEFNAYWQRLFKDKINMFKNNIDAIVDCQFNILRKTYTVKEITDKFKNNELRNMVDPVACSEKQIAYCQYMVLIASSQSYFTKNDINVFPPFIFDYVVKNMNVEVRECPSPQNYCLTSEERQELEELVPKLVGEKV